MLTPIFKKKNVATLRRRRKTFVTGILIAGLTLFSVAGILPTGMVNKAQATVQNGMEAWIAFPTGFTSKADLEIWGKAKVASGSGKTFRNFEFAYQNVSSGLWYSCDLVMTNAGNVAVDDGLLGTWSMASSTLCTYPAGDYILQLAVYATDGTAAVHTTPITIDSDMVVNWPKTVNSGAATADYAFHEPTPSIADINADGTKEIIFGTLAGDLHVFNKDGSEYSGFPINYTDGINGEVALDDIEGNTSKEMVFLTRANTCDYANPITFTTCSSTLHVVKNSGTSPSGWVNQTYTTAGVRTRPVLVDIDNNGKRDVLSMEYVSTVGSVVTLKLHAFKYNGGEVTGYPKTLTFPVNADASYGKYGNLLSVADMDGDGNKEIAFATGNQVYLYDKTGTIISGWPKTSSAHPQSAENTVFEAAPSFGDIDGDGDLEVLAPGSRPSTTYNSNSGGWEIIYAWEKNGTLMTGFPYNAHDATYTTSALAWGVNGTHNLSLADVDNDGKDEITTTFGNLQVFDYASGSVTRKFAEGAYTTIVRSQGATSIADADGDGDFDFTTGTRNVKLIDSTGNYSFERDFYALDPYTSPQTRAAKVMADLDNDGKIEIVSILQHGYKGTPNVYNDLPIVVVYVWTIPTATACTTSKYEWPAPGYDGSNVGRLSVPTPLSAPSGNCLRVETGGDTYVKQASPTSNYGTRETLSIDYNSSITEERSYMKFDLTSLSAATISSAKLKLYITSDSTATQTMKLLNTGDSNFNEATMTWNNKPTPSATTVGTVTAPNDGQWVTIDITSSATARKGGWLAFDIETTSSAGLAIASKDNVNPQLKPYLEVKY
jgi:hypothetical protein